MASQRSDAYYSCQSEDEAMSIDNDTDGMSVDDDGGTDLQAIATAGSRTIEEEDSNNSNCHGGVVGSGAVH